MLVGLVLRVLAARGDLWLDEVLTLFVANGAPSWWALLNIHHDNVHLLTALWMRLVGADAPAMIYRLPSILASTATIGLAAWHLRRLSREVAVGVACVLALSLMQVQYGSEARGYAMAGALMMFAFELQARLAERPSWHGRLLLALVAVAGMAAHLTFAFAVGGLLVQAVVLARADWIARRDGEGTRDLRRVADVAPALIAATALGVWCVAGMTIAGGTDRGAWTAVSGAFAAIFTTLADGGPRGPRAWHEISAMGSLMILVITSASVSGRSVGRWPMGLIAVSGVPPLLLLARPPEFVHERYLYLAVSAATLYLGACAGNLLRPLGSHRRDAAVVAVLYVIILGLASCTLIATGRGDVRAALLEARYESRKPSLTLAGNNDFRTKTMLAYLTPRLPPGPEISYLNGDAARAQAPDFWLEHVPVWDASTARENVALGDADYLLVSEYPAYGLSGFNWRLYRRLSPPTDR